MAIRKSFQTYAPAETHEIELNGTVFPLKPSVPGAVILDFLSGADTENAASMAKTITSLLDAAIQEDHLEAWHAYIKAPENNVTLELLSEIAGYVQEVMGGNPQSQSPMYSAG